MTKQSFAKVVGSIAVLVAIMLTTLSIKAPRVKADDDDSRVSIGFKIAPVSLNLEGKDRAKVGLGSYLVNAVGDCNGCHSSGSAPLGLYPYVTGNNPYFNQPETIDPSVYLAGGASFGTVGLLLGRTATQVRPSLPGTLRRTRLGGRRAVTRLPSSSRSYGRVPTSITSTQPARRHRLRQLMGGPRQFAFPPAPSFMMRRAIPTTTSRTAICFRSCLGQRFRI